MICKNCKQAFNGSTGVCPNCGTTVEIMPLSPKKVEVVQPPVKKVAVPPKKAPVPKKPSVKKPVEAPKKSHKKK